jgi:type IV secretory pathway TrbL component
MNCGQTVCPSATGKVRNAATWLGLGEGGAAGAVTAGAGLGVAIGVGAAALGAMAPTTGVTLADAGEPDASDAPGGVRAGAVAEAAVVQAARSDAATMATTRTERRWAAGATHLSRGGWPLRPLVGASPSGRPAGATRHPGAMGITIPCGAMRW